jgi:hypothetical protein
MVDEEDRIYPMFNRDLKQTELKLACMHLPFVSSNPRSHG